MSFSNKSIYSITEFNSFTRNNEVAGYQPLPESTFDILEHYLLSQEINRETDQNEILALSYHRTIGKIITAKNYVGILTVSDGTVIEILPKIAGLSVTDEEARKILLLMLQTLSDVPYIESNISNLDTAHLNLYEIFIKMFLEEIVKLTKVGIKSAYSIVEKNERFFKGKLKATENISNNLIHKERFYVQYENFNANRPENRIIKSTLYELSKLTREPKNQQLIIQLLGNFDNIDFSNNYEIDFSKSVIDRSTQHYETALSWCRIFLKELSFTSNMGDEVGIALLFPMERLFESYIADIVRKIIHKSEFQISTQDSRYSLFSEPAKAFALRPDIVLESDTQTIVIDTKWKILSDRIAHNGISQADMYQMYAYGKKYDADTVVLLYPYSDNIENKDLSYISDDGVSVIVKFVDLRTPFESIGYVINDILRH